MPLQDLTPQLRTRLSRMEKIMGWFITAAIALVVLGFGYYLYRTAEQRGWFEVQAPFCTYADSGEGLTVGDPVKLMGFSIGRITEIYPMPPSHRRSDYNVMIKFLVVGTNYNYIWSGNSRVRFVGTGLIGEKHLDISKGTNGYNVYMNYPVKEMSLADIKSSPRLAKLRLGQEVFQDTELEFKPWVALSTNLDKIAATGLTNLWVIDATSRSKEITGVWNETAFHYEPFEGTNVYTLPPDESPAIMDIVQGILTQVQAALPNFLALTNQLAATLSNTEQLTSNLNAVAAEARPAVSNVAVITANLRDPHGSLGEWLIPTNLNDQLTATLVNANGAITNVNITLTNVNTNLVMVFEDIGKSLDNLADMTGGLAKQVEANTNILTEISTIIVNTDDLIQGLKKHWFLRSAFKPEKTNTPPATPPKPATPAAVKK
jgi:ABC-type transporter Mla subunit MlaD